MRRSLSLSGAFADPDVVLAQDNDVRLQVAVAINSMRRFRNLSQAELASNCGLTQRDVSLIEGGDWNVTVKTLEKLIAGLGGRLVFAILPKHWARPSIVRPE